MLNEDQVAFTTQYLPWIHAVERSAQRRLTDPEIDTLIGMAVAAGFLQQGVLQQQIIDATSEFLVGLRVEQDETIPEPE